MIFRLAKKSDDVQLRKLMRETIIPGHIKMIYAREPNFFDSHSCKEKNSQVIVAENEGSIEGIGCRSIRELYVNGQAQTIGYLSGLRLSVAAQNGTTLARGYSYLQQLHRDNKTQAYLTTIIQGNECAEKILTSKRAGLPSYTPMGSYLTYVIPVRTRPLKDITKKQLDIVPADQIPESELLDFLNKEGSRRQFFPVCNQNDHGEKILNTIGTENVLLALKKGKIAGTMAVWDQGKHQQHIIAGYSPAFRAFRPFLNLGLRLKNRHSLPAVGKQIRYATAALNCIADDDIDVFQNLLQHALNKASSDGLHQLALGMHEDDPLQDILKNYFHVLYRSGLYLVSWDNDSFIDSLDNTLVPYLELGAL